MKTIAAFAAAASAQNLHATLAPVGDDVIDFSAESFLMTYELSNAGSEPATFLPWKTPLDDIWEDVIQVFDSKGREIEYTGKVARRGCVTDDDYMTIGAGATLKAVVDLTRAYQLPTDGRVTINLRHMNSTDAPQYKTVNKVALDMQKTALAADRFDATTFGACTTAQIGNIQTGLEEANRQIASSIACTSGSGPGAGCPYVEWFGTVTATRFSRVQTCWLNVRRDLPNSNWNCCVGCGGGCGRNLYAYVYPTDPNQVIYLCNLYFTIPDERAETITHEQTHFRVSCSTNDWTYGQSSCRSLAISNPDRAVDNADNYCYFGRFAERG